MGRIWVLAGAMIAALLVLLLMGDLSGPQTLLTASAPLGAGVAAAYLQGESHFMRGVWALVGVLIGALGFVLGAAAFPDTSLGLFLSGAVPIALIALATMFTRSQSDFLAGILGAGSLTAVYATRFNIDPQSLNVSLPIAIGQCLLPLGVGYLVGMLVRAFGSESPKPAEPSDDAEPGPADETIAMEEVR